MDWTLLATLLHVVVGIGRIVGLIGRWIVLTRAAPAGFLVLAPRGRRFEALMATT